MPLIHIVIPFIKKTTHSFTFLLINLLFISLQLVEHPPCVGSSSKYFAYTVDPNWISLLFWNPTHPKRARWIRTRLQRKKDCIPPCSLPFFAFWSLLIFIFINHPQCTFVHSNIVNEHLKCNVHCAGGGNTILINTIMVPDLIDLKVEWWQQPVKQPLNNTGY